MSVGLILCCRGLAVFIYSLMSMDWVRAISNSSLAIIGIFLGIAGFIVFLTSAFSSGSLIN
jgi:hypothetical protein